MYLPLAYINLVCGEWVPIFLKPCQKAIGIKRPTYLNLILLENVKKYKNKPLFCIPLILSITGTYHSYKKSFKILYPNNRIIQDRETDPLGTEISALKLTV
jgi:hypothetical protein